MRILALLVCSVVLSTFGVALAQNRNVPRGESVASLTLELDDEVIVTGKQLGELRAQVEKSREYAWGIFNDINSTNDFDVACRDEVRTGTHATHRVCAPRFEGRITNSAAKEYLAALFMTCPAGSDGGISWQACMSSAYAQRGQSRAKAVSAEAPRRRNEFSDEVFKLASENDQFARAILDFYAVQQKYEAARKPAGRPKGEDD